MKPIRNKFRQNRIHGSINRMNYATEISEDLEIQKVDKFKFFGFLLTKEPTTKKEVKNWFGQIRRSFL